MGEKTFDPDVVLRSLRIMVDTFEESGCKDEALLSQFSKLISQIKMHRWQDFSRKQRWQLDQLQSEVEQKRQLHLNQEPEATVQQQDARDHDGPAVWPA